MPTAAAEGVQPVHFGKLGEDRRAGGYKTPAALIGMKEKEPSAVLRLDLPRSASYTYMPGAVHYQHKYVNANVFAIKGSFTEADSSDDAADGSPPDSLGWNTPDEFELRPSTDSVRDLAGEQHQNLKIVLEKLAQEKKTNGDSKEPPSLPLRTIHNNSAEKAAPSPTSSSPSKPRLSRGSSLATKLNHKSWISSQSNSRSTSTVKASKRNFVSDAIPEPSRQDNAHEPSPPPEAQIGSRKSLLRWNDTTKSPKLEPLTQRREHTAPSAETLPERPLMLRRKSICLRDKFGKPTAGQFRAKSSDEGLIPPVPDIPTVHKSFFTDRLPSGQKDAMQYDRAAPVPRIASPERTFSGSHISLTKKKDELWSIFRALDGDYAKLASKSVALKANVAKASLLPFLRQYASHPSNSRLRPEDLDRRANILNKWWSGLLGILHSCNNRSISGIDHTAIIDGISGIMERPEWRLPLSPTSSIDTREKRTRYRSDQSPTFASPSTSESLTESVHNNVSNIFLQNLSFQMAFVVDKMAMRNAYASLDTFCGKTCAYAFMFVPGMADILVRLWGLPVTTLRRVLEENSIGKFDKLADVSQSIVACFPPALQSLGFLSLPEMLRKLRTPPPLPLGTNNTNWWGYWLERWTGRESDLFYVFVKHYHILVADFLPEGVTKSERMCVPGLLMVHAQILTNLDATIHRDAKPSGKDTSPASSSSILDHFAGPDAVVSMNPSLPANATRMMAENRLIMLIRDFVPERAADRPLARQLFAESFNYLLQSATRGTSVFDHSACYTLLDFLEEALVILARFEHVGDNESPLINSKFWVEVCKKMTSSENTLTEIRLYAFLYTIWDTVVSDADRKADISIGFLLDPAIFESRFNHWCPMVRAYYMRLLCWRVGRFDGEPVHCDLKVYQTMHVRLSLAWSHYLWLRQDAEQRHVVLPPTNPCNPAPSRSLLIIRTDTPANIRGGSFHSFNAFVPPKHSSCPSTTERFSEPDSMMEVETYPDSSHSTDESGSPAKAIRSIIRNMMTSRNRPRSLAPLSPELHLPNAADGFNDAQHADLNHSIFQDRHRNTNTTTPSISLPPTPSETSHTNSIARSSSFKFSLDFNPNVKAPGSIRLFPPRLPKPAQEFLQARCAKADGAQHLQAVEPKDRSSRECARYTGRALAEWMMAVGECQSFFEKRKSEGVAENRLVETPALGVEVFKRG